MSDLNPALAVLDQMGVPNGPAVYEHSTGAVIEPARWGHDHYSTLAYLETRIVDHKGAIEHDQMRCHSHHPALLAAKRRGSMLGQGAGDRYPTQLRDGAKASHHDDYDCIADMVAAGYVEVVMPEAEGDTLITGLVEQQMMASATYRLTETGQDLAALLRQHRAAGGGWGAFRLPSDAPTGAHAAPAPSAAQ